MTRAEYEKIIDNAMREMGAKVRNDIKKEKTPQTKESLMQKAQEWGQKSVNIRDKIIRRENSGYYKQHPEAAKADWEECYYARLKSRAYGNKAEWMD